MTPPTRAKRLLLVLSMLSSLTCSRQAHSFCYPEQSPCYLYDHYTIYGSPYCRRWYDYSSDNVYLLGLASGITPSDYFDWSKASYSTWKSAAYALPVLSFLVAVPPDTSTVSYVLFVDDATWTARGMNQNAAGLTYSRVYPDGTVAHGRTWLHLNYTQWRWSPDCLNENCNYDPNTGTPAALDFPSVITHELGHWWVLRDISVSGCESVIMWYSVALAQVKRSLAYADAFGAVELYDQPTAVGNSFSASPGSAQDTLRWEESDPSRSGGYLLAVSDACWGPFAQIATINPGDPRYTPDGRFYTYISPAIYQRPYVYQLYALSTGEEEEATSARTMGIPPTPPGTPTGLTATLNGTHVNLSWTASAGIVDAYYVYRHWLHLTSCDVRFQSPWTTFGPVTGTMYEDTSPPTGSRLYYYVRAVNATGGSGLSNEAAADLTVVGVDDQVASTRTFRVDVSPNPAQGVVLFTVEVPDAEPVSLSVYDLSGRLVRRFDPGGPAVTYHIRWDLREESGERVRSGLYFVRLRAAAQERESRVVVVQ
jgi:hypothetical protein